MYEVNGKIELTQVGYYAPDCEHCDSPRDGEQGYQLYTDGHEDLVLITLSSLKRILREHDELKTLKKAQRILGCTK